MAVGANGAGRRRFVWILAGLLAGLPGCAGIRHDAVTVEGAGKGAAAGAYVRNLSTLVAADRVARLAGDTPQRKALAREASLLETAEPAAAPVRPGRKEFDGAWRNARHTLRLAPGTPGDSGGSMHFNGDQSRRLDIGLRDITGRGVTLDLACDGPVTYRRNAGTAHYIAIPAGKDMGVTVTVAPSVNACTLNAAFPGAGRRTYRLVRTSAADADLAALDNRYDVCAAPAAGGDRLAEAFLKPRWLSQTCPFSPGKARSLRDERDAFNAKVEALLGHKLAPGFFDRADPLAPIDFSGAPRLSLIYVSYLDIKADFSGKVIDRLLRHHAARGAIIRIIASEALEREKDRAMLYRLAADYPNVEYRGFRWNAPAGSGFKGKVYEAIRVHHVKMLAAVSPDRGRSAVVIGSRNIHDGYLYREPVDMSAHPDLNQYRRSGGLTLDYYSNWTDFDLALTDDAAVRVLASHLSTFWNGDADTWVSRPMSVAGTAKAADGRGLMRHFISVPFADGQALEDYYADLFNAADHSIEIVNPYLNLTDKLRVAFEAALDRGVKVTIVGRIKLYGDLGGAVLTELNTLFLKRYGDRITFREYTDPGVLLHAKILMIDERLVVVSSVNLNNRSFLHDTENGVAMLDAGFYRQIKQTFDHYFAAAEAVDYGKGSAFWRAVLRIRLLREAL